MQRAEEIEQKTGELTRRMDPQILNLEADDLTGPARPRVAAVSASCLPRPNIGPSPTSSGARRSKGRPAIRRRSAPLEQVPQMAQRLGEMPVRALRRLYE